MKTKEEILEEIFYKPETQDWYKPVLKAMETYAQQLRQPPVMVRSEQLPCSCDNPNGFKEMEQGRETCSECKKPY